MNDVEQETRPAYTPPEGRPGPQELKHRGEAAVSRMKLRGIQPAMGPQQMVRLGYLEYAVRLLLEDKGIATPEELDYYVQLAQMLSLEEVAQTQHVMGVPPQQERPPDRRS